MRSVVWICASVALLKADQQVVTVAYGDDILL